VIRISSQQMEMFAEHARLKFRERMVAHLEHFFPKETGSHEQRQALVDEGIPRAARHGIVSEQDVCSFIDLMAILGRGFDQATPWVGATLADSSLGTPGRRLEIVHEAAVTHFRRTGKA
jgi:hypothetical protein